MYLTYVQDVLVWLTLNKSLNEFPNFPVKWR